MISGYSLRAPKSKNKHEFFENLKLNVDMTSESQRYPAGYKNLPPRTGTLEEIDRFDHKFFCFSKNQTDKMDIAIRIFMEVVHEAILDARLSVDALRGTNTGVYVGHCFSDFLSKVSHDPKLTGYELVNGAHAMAANKISFFYDLRGPSMAIDTACSSSCVALQSAFAAIERGEIDRAIVGGLSLTLDPHKNAVFNAFTMLSPDGRCHTFDVRANGYCRSEGVVAVVIESPRVRSHGYARLLGVSSNNDGHTPEGITYPSRESQAQNAKSAFAYANVCPSTISYIEAHGTGTVAGDREELAGLERVFAPSTGIPIGALKANMGHAEGASGLLSIAKCLLMYEARKLFPVFDFESTPHDTLQRGVFKVVTETVHDWIPGNVCVSNYGFGGSNAFVILAPGNVTFSSCIERPLVFSNAPLQCLPNGGGRFWRDLVALKNDDPFTMRSNKAKGRDSARLCFVFGGQGSQWDGMGKQLMKDDGSVARQEFISTMHRLDEVLESEGMQPGLTSLTSLFETGDKWSQREYSSLGIVAYQIATVNILRRLGYEADFFIGHSVGEVAACYAAGNCTERECILLATIRSEFAALIRTDCISLNIEDTDVQPPIEKCSNGKSTLYYAPRTYKPEGDVKYFDLFGGMAAVGEAPETIQRHIDALGFTQTVIACYNSPNGQTLSGPCCELDELHKRMTAEKPDIFWRKIDTGNVAYHAPHMSLHKELIQQKFETVLKGKRSAMDDRLIPTNGRSAGGWVDAAYHTENMLNPVYFHQAIMTLPDDVMVVEIGSSSSLTGQIKRTRTDIQCVGIVTRNDPDTESLYDEVNLRELFWKHGYRTSDTVDLSVQVPVHERDCTVVWDHTEKHRVIEYHEFEHNNNGIGVSTRYDLEHEHAFLLDHRVGGRALFPAMGYVDLIWKTCNGCLEAVAIYDLEIHEAFVLDGMTDVEFETYILDGKRVVVRHGATTLASATVAFSKLRSLGDSVRSIHEDRGDEDDVDVREVIVADEFYNDMRRYGYEWRGAFRSMEHRTLPGVVPGRARITKVGHLIPYLDAMLQLFVADVNTLHLPTMLRELVLHPAVTEEMRRGSTIHIAHHKVETPYVLLRGLKTTPTTPPQVGQPVCILQRLHPLSSVHTCSLSTEVLDYVAWRVIEFTENTPSALEEYPHISNVLEIARNRLQGRRDVGCPERSCTFVRIYCDLYDDLDGLLKSPLSKISMHAEHYKLYLEPQVAASDEVMDAILSIVSKDFSGKPLSIMEVGCGTGVTARRILDMCHVCVGSYLATDLRSIRLGEGYENDKRVRTANYDVNRPVESGQYDLIVASNALHCASDIETALTNVCSGLVPGGYLLLDETTSDAACFLWGLDKFVWNTATDARSNGLWMSVKEWEKVVARVPQLEWITRFDSNYGSSMLLKKKAPSITRERIFNWTDVSSTVEQEFCGDGAEGFVRTLHKESVTDTLTAVTVVRGEPPPVPAKHAFASYVDKKEHVLVALDAAHAPPPAPNRGAHTRLLQTRVGDISSFTWTEAAPGPVRICFASLNFKDCMLAYGKLHAHKEEIGFEFSGVDEYGTAVMGIGKRCFASSTKPGLSWNVPCSMSLAEAATIPIVYCTVLYALIFKAGLKKGDAVLIHAGAGGVGHAAIHTCKMHGIEVFATCSPEKREYLVEAMGIADERVGSSRDTSFVDMVMAATDGMGVHCVLNSLSDALLPASIQCLRPHGHFCEIGKYDFQNNSKLNMESLEANISFHAIDIATMHDDPKHAPQLHKLLSDALEAGNVKALPYDVFTAECTEEAFRFIGSGKHKGKVVVDMQGFVPAHVQSAFHTTGTHIITGGLGGFGLELAQWLAARGARRLVLTSRRGVTTGSQKHKLRMLAKHAEVEVATVDASSYDATCKLVGQHEGELRGIWHLAMVLEDSMFANMTPSSWNSVNETKVKGLKHLDEATSHLALDAFVVFSSISVWFGNAGQSSYAHANSACETVILRRHLEGKKALAIQWGPIDNVGAALDSKFENSSLRELVEYQNIDNAIAEMDLLLSHSEMYPVATVYEPSRTKADTCEYDDELTLSALKRKLARITGEDEGRIREDVPLGQYGVDSLSLVELNNFVKTKSLRQCKVTNDMTLCAVMEAAC